MAAASASQADMRFASDATLRWWSPDGTVQYGFCGVCGASMFWRTAEDAPNVSIGVGTLDHFVAGVHDGHAAALLAASVFHFGTFTVAQVKRHLAAAGVPVRPA
jgi:hypothetical protein